MNEKEFLKKIGINIVGHYNSDGDYVIDIENSDAYGKIFSLLTKSDYVEEDNSEGTSILTSDAFEQYFIPIDEKLDFTIILRADIDKDSYSLVVEL